MSVIFQGLESRHWKHLDRPDVFYFTHASRAGIFDYVNGQVVIHHDQVAKLKQYRLVVANLSTELWTDTVKLVYDILEQGQINFILLSHDPKDHLARPCMVFHPNWYHVSINTLLDQGIGSDTRQYKISCLNAKARPHRIYNYIQLRNKPYFKDCCISFSNKEIVRGNDVALDSHTKVQWEMIKSSLHANVFEANFTGPTINIPAFTDTYINLVAETHVIAGLFVTEKTWKAVAAGQLFLIVGSPGTVAYLRDQGVDTFDDLIDHKYYDNEPDWRLRIDRVHQLLDLLVTQDLPELYRRTHARRLANQQKFFKGDFDKTYNIVNSMIETNVSIR